ncbi:MAG: FAD-binding oxidoreductase [Flavobacteriaceae bacterium]
MSKPIPPDLLEKFAALAGPNGAIADPADQKPYLQDWRDLFRGTTPLVLRPRTSEAVAAIMELAHETNTPIVPQGGSTGLVGGQIPVGGYQQLILSLTRMDRIRSVDREGMTLVAEAGCTLQAVQEAAAGAGQYFGLRLGSQGTCRIGGNLATNAGGTGVIAYGSTRHLCLGLEVVLADGRVWNGLRALKKDNTGYDLRDLFIGSEGTLGVITAAVMKMHPAPKSQVTAFVAVASPRAAIDTLNRALGAVGPMVTAAELLPRFGLDIVLRHGPGLRDPLSEPAPWYLLLEFSTGSEDPGLHTIMERILAGGLDDGSVLDAAIATSLKDAGDFWAIRDVVSEVQKAEGGSIKHDVSVPVAAIPAFIEEGNAALEKAIPGCRPLPYGHLGDGNIHFNVSQPVGADKDAFLARWDEINALLHGIVHRFHGSISAEHGIGQLKRHLMAEVKEPVELEMMRAIKAAFDPKGILNPDKVI